jgi:uncharacterized protein YjdB
MKRTNLARAAFFVVAAVAGSLIVGAGVFAQSMTPVSCSPATFSLPMGQSVTLTASGGDSNYLWSSPGLVVTNPTGMNFNVSFNAVGTYPVTVVSAGTSSTCSITVTAATAIPATISGTTTTVPGLPSTGELPE